MGYSQEARKTVLFGSLLHGSAIETTESKYDEGYFCVSNEDGTGHPEQCSIFGFYASTNTVRVQSWNGGESWKYFGDVPDNDDNSDDSGSGSGSGSGSASGSGSDSDCDLDSDSDSDCDCDCGYDPGSGSNSESDNDEEDTDEKEEEEEMELQLEDEEKVDEKEEMEEQEDNEVREFRICCSPVLHMGRWYCLGGGGSLRVYDPKRIDWSVLGKPTSFGSEFPHKNCYLVESSQELLAVLTGRNGTPIHVLKLKQNEMTWERMDSLGSRTIFTGTVASLSMARPPKAMANKVYLPKFYGHPPIIPTKLTTSGGRLFFVPERKEMQQPSSNKSVYTFMGEHGSCGDKDGAWCYDMELDSGVDKQIGGYKNMLQYI